MRSYLVYLTLDIIFSVASSLYIDSQNVVTMNKLVLDSLYSFEPIYEGIAPPIMPYGIAKRRPKSNRGLGGYVYMWSLIVSSLPTHILTRKLKSLRYTCRNLAVCPN
jgi:hypothetical protein